MIKNMHDFTNCVHGIRFKLLNAGYAEEADKLNQALMISQSSLEILGGVKNVIKKLRKTNISDQLLLGEEIFQAEAFIKKYW